MKIFEQKPVKIDDFNEAEEKEVKEHVQKRKRKKEVAEKNKLVKKKKKQEQDEKRERIVGQNGRFEQRV